ncbi:MAG: hypothetical protein M3422_05400 [Actinomycetota bacterium]|nr:hypothetical protein [Actinomycetota bacterium]
MVKIQSKYRDARPASVLKWEQQVLSATTHEEAQTQMLYELNLQTLKLLRLAQVVVAVFCVAFVLGVILVII